MDQAGGDSWGHTRQGHGMAGPWTHIVWLGLSLGPMTHPGETQSILIVPFFLIL